MVYNHIVLQLHVGLPPRLKKSPHAATPSSTTVRTVSPLLPSCRDPSTAAAASPATLPPARRRHRLPLPHGSAPPVRAAATGCRSRMELRPPAVAPPRACAPRAPPPPASAPPTALRSHPHGRSEATVARRPRRATGAGPGGHGGDWGVAGRSRRGHGLWTIEEKDIAIVSHSGFLYHTLNKDVKECHPIVEELGNNFVVKQQFCDLGLSRAFTVPLKKYTRDSYPVVHAHGVLLGATCSLWVAWSLGTPKQGCQK